MGLRRNAGDSGGLMTKQESITEAARNMLAASLALFSKPSKARRDAYFAARDALAAALDQSDDSSESSRKRNSSSTSASSAGGGTSSSERDSAVAPEYAGRGVGPTSKSCRS